MPNHTPIPGGALAFEIPLPDLEGKACGPNEFDLFFGPEGEGKRDRNKREAAARQLCGGRAVQQACLEWAIQTNTNFGTWGGKTPAERRGLARARNRRQP